VVDYVAVYQSGAGTTPPSSSPPGSGPPSSGPPSSGPPSSGPPSSPPGSSSSSGNPGGTIDAYGRIEAEAYAAQNGVATQPTTDTGGGGNLTSLSNGDWVRFDRVEFGSGGATNFQARVACGASGGISGLVQVRLDSPTAAPVGNFAIADTGGWQSWRTVPGNVNRVTGVHTVFLTFDSGQPADFVNVNWLTFVH
jgi:hypothetical protein